MSVQHSPPARKSSRYRGPNLEGAVPSIQEGRGPRRSYSFSGVVGGFPGIASTTVKGPGEDDEEVEENSVEEEHSDGTEGVPAPVGASQGTGGPTIAQSNKPVSHQYEPSWLAIMHKITQIMTNIEGASSSEASRPPAFKTPFMTSPDCFDKTQSNSEASFSLPYLSNLTNKDPEYLLDNWGISESQLFTLFGDPNEVRKAEAELDALRIKEGGHVSLQIAHFRILVSRIGDQGERALIYHFRKGLPSRIVDQLASHSPTMDYLQDLMEITLELHTRYHERQKQKIHFQEKKSEASKSVSPYPQNYSSSNQKKKKNFHFQKRDKPHSSLMNKDFKSMGSEKERSVKEGLYAYCGGKNILEFYFKRP
ncbi:hypothetical protein O181_000079 [Austropuccinia psidii MF-1]|uniref:Uncharacterized protein n=1 Tax=Austropuccinia psidii MF-1 TaxID=1389203 RepID=A0A9Q3B7Z2_9BASI|nr:hypothetical protein [Austropuccinia psidii MF-1]